MCTKYVCYGICERRLDKPPAYDVVFPNLTRGQLRQIPFPHVTCDRGHRTHAFLASDQQIHCLGRVISDPVTFCNSTRGWNVFVSGCDGLMTSLPVPFLCRIGTGHVHYTLVCDHRQDCWDNSDEDFCTFPPCDRTEEFQCETRGECQPLRFKCDHHLHCIDGSDEADCQSKLIHHGRPQLELFSFITDMEGKKGFPILTRVQDTSSPYCPTTHFLCPSDGNCHPLYLRCNRVADCAGKEDEQGCESYVCPGLYRCRGRELCVLPIDLCDGIPHCPQQDDERFCHLPCPAGNCTCLGHAFVCRLPFQRRHVPQLRYLDARGSGMQLQALAKNIMLIYLNLARCNVTEFNITLPNLKTFDLSDNKITTIGFADLIPLPKLEELKLSGNPITSIFSTPLTGAVQQINSVQVLDLSRVEIRALDLSVLSPFIGLQSLNLSKSHVEIVHIVDTHVSLPRTLRELDAHDCAFTEFPRTLFQGVENLQVVYADTYKLCCPGVLPDGFAADSCYAPFDEISSCEDLLRSNFYRACLSVLATFALTGNSVSFLVRVCTRKAKRKSGFGVFVQHLCLSDFLMGVYLVFIGVADRLLLGNYLWQDTSWRHSASCNLAGFLSLASSEVSAFIILLITVDRFLVLRFPFSQMHFQFLSAQITSVAAWIVGSALAAIPLLPSTRSWQFYSQTGICIPLPVTRQDFAGHRYAFGVMIVLNLILFILIAGGQVSIYASVQASKMSERSSSSKTHDSAIARRLITVVVSDFLCWFPVGLLGLLVSSGTAIPGEVNVAMAIFVLPLNSALNPFLYTLNMLQERLWKLKEKRMLETLLQQRQL